MTREMILKTVATITATYAAAELSLSTPGDDQLWEIRDSNGTPFHWVKARVDWACDVEAVGVEILASTTR